MKRRNQQAVALIVTLMMLSVITFMAVAFLFLSRREKGAVTTATDQAISALAADTALERAKSEALARILAFTNDQVIDLMVPTNFINRYGLALAPPAAYASPTNVNYDFTQNAGNPLNRDQLLQNIANLWYNPRPPVFYSNEFRFYLDLNRNGIFDTNGFLPVFSGNQSLPYVDTNGFFTANLNEAWFQNFMGDPEWIGILERPELPHSSSNRFVARYTYLAVPADRTLDVNFVHNQAKSKALPAQSNPTADGFLRNQGMGPWDINLAAFFTDLNTNVWNESGNPYQYFTNTTIPSRGWGFEDALSLLRYRYSLDGRSVNGNFNNLGASPVLDNPDFDEYSNGLLMGGTHHFNDINDQGTGFPGADNPNHFFTHQDFFDPIKTSPEFVGRLNTASAGTNSYDRYTYYRMLAQLGTASAPEEHKLNLNYVNVDANGKVIPGLETNQIPWNPLQFFTNAAAKLLGSLNLRQGTNALISGTNINIPLYPTNYYTPAVHRMLQLAANMQDATTNRFMLIHSNAFIPSVFRPIFNVTADPGGGSNIVSICGYVEEIGTNILERPYLELRNMSTVLQDINTNNVYGVPWIIGAKKGFPNFNEYAMETRVQVTRKLEFRRPPGNPNSNPVNETNQMYLIGVSNLFGVEAWNSYSNAFARPLRLYAAVDLRMVLSNETRVLVFTNFSFSNVVDLASGEWTGFIDAARAAQSFQIPLATGTNFLPISTWRSGQTPELVPVSGTFQRNIGFPVPKWWVNFRTRVRFALIDRSVNRIVDYVNLDDDLDESKQPLNITYTLMADALPADPNKRHPGAPWFTNRVSGSSSDFAPTYGIMNQISMGYGPPPNDWDSFSLNPQAGNDVNKAIDGFRVNMGLSPIYYPRFPYFKSNIFYAPFDPSRSIYVRNTWQANDPLVHYTLSDLAARTNDTAWQATNPRLRNLGLINERYEPWGGNPSGSSTSPSIWDLAVKDPLVWRSDDWDFPTNKLPNLGWLGRVHRGTPWQTIYLKSSNVAQSTWTNWAGKNSHFWNLNGGRTEDIDLYRPVRDQSIFDFFTTAITRNAEHGRLSINQTNLAAWSAILSGVLVLTNSADDDVLQDLRLSDPNLPPPSLPIIIEPAGAYVITNPTPVADIVQGINRIRSSEFPRDVFTNLGNILSVPELSVRSPFLNRATQTQRHFGISEAMYERIPQQILSLLTVNHTPRFVIYSYGQTLRPAPQSVVLGGNFSLLCTNYQITAETATRAVVRVEGTPDERFRESDDMFGRRYPPRIVVEQFNVLPPD